MKLLISSILLFSLPFNMLSQSFDKDDIRKHKIKKVFINGPNSGYYDIEEYDTAGNLLFVSEVINSTPPFIKEELKYRSTTLIERVERASYNPERIEITRYFYNGSGLLMREEDTVICPDCKIPKRVTEYEYNDSSLLVFEKYQSGNFNTIKRRYYNDKGLLSRIEAWDGNNSDFSHYYFYDEQKKLSKDSVYNFISKGSLRNYYKYDSNGRLAEVMNMSGRLMYYQAAFTYDNEGLLKKIINKQKADESKEYYTAETYFNFEKY